MLSIRCLLLWLLLLLASTVFTQHIFVQSYHEDAGHWIVTPAGETLCELPVEWSPVGISRSAAMAVLEDWPLLVWKRGRKEPNKYALIKQDGSWQDLAPYNLVRQLGYGLYLTQQIGEKLRLRRIAGPVLAEGFSSINPYNENGLAVAEYRKLGNGRQGILDTLGRWAMQPTQKKITDLGYGRYWMRDTLGRTYLLAKKTAAQKTTSGELAWDTLRWAAAEDPQLNSLRPFNEQGATWLSIGKQQQQQMDTTGQLFGETLLVSQPQIKPFNANRATVTLHQPTRQGVINTNGEWVIPPVWKHILDYQDSRALAHDTLSDFFGYLDRDGSWAIAPQYCHASSFRHGLAVVANPADQELCLGRIKQISEQTYEPSKLTRSRVIRDYQVIDTSGIVVWEGRGQKIAVPVAGVVGINNSPTTQLPAYRLEWLASGNYWLCPGFVFTDWAHAMTAKRKDVVHLDLGTLRRQIFNQSIYPLPPDFSQQLPLLTELTALNLNHHEVSENWETLLAQTNLRKLELSACKLVELPRQIDKLNSLEELDLSSNQLTELPRSIFRMRHLRVLNIADNPLPPAIIPRLRKALPGTEIIYK